MSTARKLSLAQKLTGTKRHFENQRLYQAQSLPTPVFFETLCGLDCFEEIRYMKGCAMLQKILVTVIDYFKNIYILKHLCLKMIQIICIEKITL